MCRRIDCAKCKKPSYAGCGKHIEQVLGDVPREQRCGCRDATRTTPSGGSEKPSFIKRIFGL